jgi:hypothetical protein
LIRFPEINHIPITRHYENETLYWTKAASILGLPQENMLDSEVPIGRAKAKADLIKILSDNLENFRSPKDESELIFQGWRELCKKCGPVFLEKSPHHLLQRSALDLLVESQKKIPEIDYLFVGLIRNPMDALYSAFKRWKTFPERLQHEWYISYKNLLNFKKVIGKKFLIIRYEDMVSDKDSLKPILEFAGINGGPYRTNFFHKKSISKWKNDRRFGFILDDKVMNLAKEYGYKTQDMMNSKVALWPFYRNTSRIIEKIRRSAIDHKVKETAKRLFHR